MLCQGLAEHVLAAHLEMLLDEEPLPPKVIFAETLRRCQVRSVISEQDVKDLRKLMTLRNPHSPFRANDDPATLLQRVLQTRQSPQSLLNSASTVALRTAIRSEERRGRKEGE